MEANPSFLVSTVPSQVGSAAQNSLCHVLLSMPALLEPEMMKKGGATVPKPWGIYGKKKKKRKTLYEICLLSHPSTPTFLRLMFLGQPSWEDLVPLTPKPFFSCQGSQAPGALVALPE